MWQSGLTHQFSYVHRGCAQFRAVGRMWLCGCLWQPVMAMGHALELPKGEMCCFGEYQNCLTVAPTLHNTRNTCICDQFTLFMTFPYNHKLQHKDIIGINSPFIACFLRSGGRGLPDLKLNAIFPLHHLTSFMLLLRHQELLTGLYTIQVENFQVLF